MTSDEFAQFKTARLAGRPAPTPFAARDRGALAALLRGGLAEVGTLEGGEACLAAMREDAWRLAGAA